MFQNSSEYTQMIQKTKAMVPFGSHMLQYKSMAFRCVFICECARVWKKIESGEKGGDFEEEEGCKKTEGRWSGAAGFHPFATLGKHDR